MQIKEMMTRGVDSITAQHTIREAAELMRRHNVGILPVWSGERFAGTITDRDIALNLADEVATGKRTEREAREFFDKTAALSAAGKTSPYTRMLLFKPYRFGPERSKGAGGVD